jgi:hypothetical protein
MKATQSAVSAAASAASAVDATNNGTTAANAVVGNMYTKSETDAKIVQLAPVPDIGDLELTPDSGVLVTNNGQTIEKTTTGGWNRQFRSKKGFTGSAYVKFTVASPGLEFMLGLTTDPDSNNSYNSIDFAWYALGSEVSQIYENGTHTGTHPAFDISTVFEIVYQGTTIKYYQDGILEETTNTTAGQTLYVDSSFSSQNSKVNNLEFGSVPTPDLSGTSIINWNPASFTTGMEASTNGMIIRRPSSDGGGGWDHQITGLDRYRGNVYVSFRMKELDGDANHTMFGFSTDPNLNAHYNSIDFSWYVDNGGMHVYESGNQVGSATYDEESVYTIARVGSTVSYYQDGVLKRSVSGITTADLYLDSSFHSSIELRDIKVGVTYAEGGSIVAVRYTHGTMGNRVGYSGTDGTFMDGMEITMPPAKSSSSRYEVYAYSSFDNSPEDTAGGGLAIWAERPDGNSYWVHKSGSHSNYWSGSADLYMRIETHHITDGTEWSGYSGGINKGDQIKFRIYAQTHSGTNHWNVQDISSQYGPGSLFIIKEIDGGVF